MAVDMAVDVKMRNMLTFEIKADELELFLLDVNKHLQEMEAGILGLGQNGNAETLNTTFRAAHTIKGVAAAVGHTRMAELTHMLETIFDAMCEGTLSPAPVVTDELLVSVDVLKALLDEVVTRQPSDADVYYACLARLRALKGSGSGDQTPSSAASLVQDCTLSSDAQSPLTAAQAAQVESYCKEGYAVLEIDVVTRIDAVTPDSRFLQAAMALAEIGHVITLCPMQTEDQYGDCLWLILATQADIETVEETLDHVSDLAGFWVRPYILEEESNKQEARD